MTVAKYCNISLCMLRSSINIQLQCIKRSVAHRRRQILSNKRGWLRNFSWPRTHHNNRSKISRIAHWGKENGHFTWMLLCNTQSFLNRDCQWFGNPSVLNQGLQLNNNHPDECYLYVYANPFILNNNWSNCAFICVSFYYSWIINNYNKTTEKRDQKT